MLFLETVVSTAKDTEMSVRRRGEAKQANGSANGSIKHEDVNDLKTDHTRWRMKNVDGRQTWHYLESDEELKAWPMTSADMYYLGMDTVGCNIQILLHNTF